VSGFKRTAALWVLRQAARRAFGPGAQRRQGGASTGWGGTAPTGATGSTGAGYRPTREQPSRAYSAGPRAAGMQPRFEELVRRTWPLLDTPANRDRAARFVERMRTVANAPR
jgi:hypothetical protein